MPSRFPPFDNSLSEDEQVVKKFVDNIQDKLDHGILKPPIGKERAVLETAILYPGAVIGSIVTAAAFVILRKGPIYIVNRHLAKQFHNMNNTKSIPNTTAKFEPFQEGPVLKGVGSLFDAFFASMLGLTAWAVSINKQKFLMNAADIPLSEGHSDISDTLCDDFISIYSGIRPQFWKQHSDDTLMAIQTFVQNCEKRQLYQKKLKREMGMGSDDIEFELPSRVPDDIIQQEKDRFDGTDWASLEDFEESLNDDDDDFWDGK